MPKSLLFFLLFLPTLLLAQTDEDIESKYSTLLNTIEHLVLEGKAEDAWQNTLKAAELWEDSDPLFGFLEAFESGASFYISEKMLAKNGQKDYKTAAKYYVFALDKFPKHFGAYLEEEVEYLADIHTSHGFALKKISQIIEAKRAYQKAFSGYRHLDSLAYEYDKRWVSLYVYKPLANLYTRLENYENAEALLLLAKSVLEAFEKGEETAEVAIDLGILQATRGKHQEAFEIFNSLENQKNLSPYIEAILLLNRSRSLMALSEHSKALEDIKKAIILLKKDTYPVVLLDAYHVLGQLESQTQHYEKAEQSLQSAITLAAKHLPQKSRKLAKVNASLGHLYLKKEDPAAALLAFQQSLAAVMPEIDPAAISETPAYADLYAENSILMALDGKAEAFELWYNFPTHNTLELESALENLMAGFEVERLLQKTQQHSNSKIQFQNQNRSRREAALRICTILYKESGEPKYANTAFQIAEGSKSSVLLASVRENFARQQLEDQSFLLLRVKETEKALAVIETEILETKFNKESSTKNNFTQLNEQKVFLSQKLLTLQAELEEAYPIYTQFTKNFKHSSIKSIQSNLLKNNKEAFVEYFWGNQSLYVFTISKKEIGFTEIAIDSTLEQAVHVFLDLFSPDNRWNMGVNTYQDAAYDLYQKIYAPLQLQDFNKVIIVPDGLLSFVSFEALLDDKLANPFFKNMAYLINHQNIQYAYSGNILMEQQKAKKFGSQFLFVAPGFENNEQNLPKLDASGLNIGNPKNLKTLLGPNASRNNFEKEAINSRIIYLFTHAEANKGGQPKVYFQDKALSLSEIYALDLSAELVVLSACETNLGKLEKGEGVMSLARGFAYAGASGLIASLWKVKNQQTASLFNSFNQNTEKGKPTSEALRTAKLDYLEQTSDIHASPAYWTGFIFIGDDKWRKKIDKKILWYGGGGLILLIGLIYVFRQKMRA